MRKKAAKRIVDMKKSGRSWTEIAERTGFTVAQAKAEVEKAKKEVRKELSTLRTKAEESEKKKPTLDLLAFLHKEYPPYQGPHSSRYKGWIKRDFTKPPEVYERERNEYLDFLLDELGKLG